jgi:hypothetical protein
MASESPPPGIATSRRKAVILKVERSSCAGRKLVLARYQWGRRSEVIAATTPTRSMLSPIQRARRTAP